MAKEIRIDIPANTSIPMLEDYFRELIEDDHEGTPGQLKEALDLDAQRARATVDSIMLESVEFDGQSVLVHYGVGHSTYSSCEDMRYQEDDLRCIEGKRDGNTWVFTVHVSPTPLAPCEEL
jgi:hypothetical protein